MSWMPVVGVVALLALVISIALLVIRVRGRRLEALPDGDYMVTIVDVKETPQGVVTTFKIDEPKVLKGRRVVMVRGRDEDSEPEFRSFRHITDSNEPIHICRGLGYTMLCGLTRGKVVWETTESNATCGECLGKMESVQKA